MFKVYIFLEKFQEGNDLDSYENKINTLKYLNQSRVYINIFDFEFQLIIPATYIKIGKYEEALNILENYILKFKNKKHIIFNQIGYIYILKIDYLNSIKYFEKSIKFKTKYYNAYNNLGICYRNLGNFEKSRWYLSKAIELSPKYHSAYYNLALLEFKEKNYDDCIKNLSISKKLGSKLADSFLKKYFN
jgi:tetratricopeptide (TPR) repeat protein